MYKYFILILYFINLSALQFHEYCTDLWKENYKSFPAYNLEKNPFHEYCIDMWEENYEGVPYEQIIYNLIKKNPLKYNTNYLVVPWVYLIDRNEFHKLPEVKLNGGFTICGHWNYLKIIPYLQKMGIDTLFTPHAHHYIYQGIRIISIPHFAPNGIKPDVKNIFYSYVGASSHGVRKELFKIKHPENTVLLERQNWHFQLAKFTDPAELQINAKKEKEEYQRILASSRFSLCPRGAGHGTLRLWESLQAGAIPVLLADYYILPLGFDWENCLIRIPEKNVNSLLEILFKIPVDVENRMRQNCLKIFELSSGDNLVKVIRDHYKQYR